jgi:hypothetical protein
MTTANLPDMQAPVVFCQECATGFCIVIWDLDHNGEPTVTLSDTMNYCPVCGAKQQSKLLDVLSTHWGWM